MRLRRRPLPGHAAVRDRRLLSLHALPAPRRNDVEPQRFSGDPERGPMVGVRLGLIQGDPGTRPEWRQWVSSAPPWDPIPDDGLPRFDGPAPDMP